MKYSVLMSIYAKETPEFFKLAIDSMIQQSVAPDEIIVVQDGPLPDDLYQVVHGYKNEFPDLVQIVVSEKNIGLGLALNLGLEHCKNDLVARMDTDDISLPDRCKKQLEAFAENPELCVIGGNIAEFIQNENQIIGRRVVPESHNEIVKFLKRRCPFNHVTVMFKKRAVIDSGGYQHLLYNEDYHLWIRMFLNGCAFYNLKSDLVLVRVGLEMYQRRGGWKYFLSEYKIQKLMKDKDIINLFEFLSNVIKRIIVQLLLPNKLRGWVFRKFARDEYSEAM